MPKKDNWKLAQCCLFYSKPLVKKYNCGTVTKTYALKADGKQKVLDKAKQNCVKLINTLNEYFSNQPENLRAFRISSTLLPCYTLDFTNDWYEEDREHITKLLKRAGNIAKEKNIRLSVHPGQYTVLGSNTENVVKNSIKDIEYHAFIGQALDIAPENFVINIHLQGVYGGTREAGIDRFATNFQYLSDYAQKALAVENEDKPNGYDIEHTLELSKRIPIRCTLDVHHYTCHRMKETEKVKIGDAYSNRKVRNIEPILHTNPFFKEAVKTWKNIRPLFHVAQSHHPSNREYWMKPAAHSDILWDEELLTTYIPMLDYVDFDVECKQKEIAVNKFYQYVRNNGIQSKNKLSGL